MSGATFSTLASRSFVCSPGRRELGWRCALAPLCRTVNQVLQSVHGLQKKVKSEVRTASSPQFFACLEAGGCAGEWPVCLEMFPECVFSPGAGVSLLPSAFVSGCTECRRVGLFLGRSGGAGGPGVGGCGGGGSHCAEGGPRPPEPGWASPSQTLGQDVIQA